MGYGTSKLLDMRDCSMPEWEAVNRRLTECEREVQPFWFRPFLRLKHVRRRLGYDHWSRLWEYPWAALSADLKKGMRVLDVGSGGSVFPHFLAAQGCEVHSADPSLDEGTRLTIGKKKRLGLSLGIATGWGLPPKVRNSAFAVAYVPDSVQDLTYPDRYFDRVFCLSVMEHIPETEWPQCMRQMTRVLRGGGRLVMTLDMGTPNADARQYEKLFTEASLTLVGSIDYPVPISMEDKQTRHPGHTYETLGLIWDKA